MKTMWPLVLCAAVVGCSAQRPATEITPEQHAANVAAADEAGYRVITSGSKPLFCPKDAATGSHMKAPCMSETQFQQIFSQRQPSPATQVTNQMPGPGPGGAH